MKIQRKKIRQLYIIMFHTALSRQRGVRFFNSDKKTSELPQPGGNVNKC